MFNTVNTIDVFDNFFNNWDSFFMKDLSLPSNYHYPVDIFLDKTTNELVIELAVVGGSKDDIEVSTEGYDSIKVKITRDNEKEMENRDYSRGSKGISRKNFQYTWKVDDRYYDLSKAATSFKDGLLKIAIPHHESKKPLNKVLQIG